MAAPRTDADLVSRAQAGRLDAFEELVRRHRLGTYRVALRMLGDESDAEDATQDAFVQAWRNLGRFRADGAFSTWMYRIVTNRCLNMLRARRRTEPLPTDREAPASRPDRIAEARWQVEDLTRAIADNAVFLAKGEDASFQNKIHLAMDAKGFGGNEPPEAA